MLRPVARRSGRHRIYRRRHREPLREKDSIHRRRAHQNIGRYFRRPSIGSGREFSTAVAHHVRRHSGNLIKWLCVCTTCTLGSMLPNKQYKIAGETLYIYALVAYRLGLFAIKTELGRLAFKHEHPKPTNKSNRKLPRPKNRASKSTTTSPSRLSRSSKKWGSNSR